MIETDSAFHFLKSEVEVVTSTKVYYVVPNDHLDGSEMFVYESSYDVDRVAERLLWALEMECAGQGVSLLKNHIYFTVEESHYIVNTAQEMKLPKGFNDAPIGL